jgi:hypothetical protein
VVNPNPCGSGLARERALSAAIEVADTPFSPASSLPQQIDDGHKPMIAHAKTVGVSLLAMTAAQSTLMSTDTPPSRASRTVAPPWHTQNLRPTKTKLWERACSRRGPTSHHQSQLTHSNHIHSLHTQTTQPQAQTTFLPNHLSNLLSNTTKRDLIPAFQISGTGKRCFRGQKSPAIHPYNP